VPNRLEELRLAGELQARLCGSGGSPTYEAIITALVATLESDRACAELLRCDERPAESSALYLRLLAAVHRVALTDLSCPLRRYLPSTGGSIDPERAVSAFFDVVEEHAEMLRGEMAGDVQTNDVGRSAALSAAMGFLGGPLRLLEIGASAGLNLWLDRYRVVVDGHRAWGPIESPVSLTDHFETGDPPITGWSVVERRGCDLHPLDLAEASARLRLRSFVWPEHVDRRQLLDAAMATAGPVEIDAEPAGPWLGSQLRSLPGGVTTVVFHSIVVPYLSEVQRTQIEDAILEAGRSADPEHRLAWVSFEPTQRYEGIWLSCRQFPGDIWLRLATSTPHGRRIRWDPTAIPGIDWVAPERAPGQFPP
jgi:hypothetical protein